jgi:colicin import membrane protein
MYNRAERFNKMAERRENSVLFSLRELRQIEDDRVKQEEEEVRRREEAMRQARLAEERARLEAEERVRREAEEAEIRRLQQEELRVREEQLRLEEAARRHQIDAQARLEEQRLRMEIDAKTQLAARRKPWGLISAAAVLFVLVAGLGIFLYVQKQDAIQAQRIAAAKQDQLMKQIQELQQQMADQQAQMADTDAQIKKNFNDLNAAKDAQVIAQLKAEAERLQAKRKAQAEEFARIKDRERRLQPVDTTKTKCKPNDPLCGIN